MSLKEKTLIILTPGFPESETDSTCLPMQQNLVRSLKEIYPQLNIVVLSFQYPYFKREYKWFDATVISFDGRNKGGFSRLMLRQKLYSVLKKINLQNEIIGLLSFWCGECALVGKRFADKHGLKHFCWILGQDAKKENKYAKRIQPKAGELIALSDFLQDEFERGHGIRPRHLIPAAIDERQFNAAINKKDIDILGAGSLIPLKQYDIFIETIAEIKKQMPAVKAILVGGGPEEYGLQNIINEYKLQGTVALSGELPHHELLQLMQRSKLFLHPSSYEGFSGVCLEALYAGAHVISFCKAMYHPINHWHIVNTKKEMKQTALEILQNPQSEYQSVIVFKMDDIAKRMMNLFDT